VRSIGSSLVVGDDGPGIPAEHAAHVFDRFYRVDGARPPEAGSGLAIARELAEAMGGTLELESTAGARLHASAAARARRFHVENDGGADERFVPAGEARTPRDEVATDATRLR
jgi:signal transduction histidine kinase